MSGLTSEFGMGSGISRSLLPPRKMFYGQIDLIDLIDQMVLNSPLGPLGRLGRFVHLSNECFVH